MTEAEILDGIRKVVRRQLGVDATLALDDDLAGALQLDSLQQLELVVGIEDHFRIRLDDLTQHEARSLGDLVALIARCLHEQRQRK